MPLLDIASPTCPSEADAPPPSDAPHASRRRRGVASVVLALAAVASLGACGDDTSAQASTSAIGASDISRIAAGNKPRTSTASGAATSTSASATGATSGGTGSSPAASATNAAIVIPDAAKAHTKEGAKAFVKFYWATLDRLDREPRNGLLEHLAATDCTSCQTQQQHVADLVNEKSHVETDSPRSSDWLVRSDSTNDSVVIRNFYQDQGCKHVSGGKTLRSYPPTKTTVETRADWRDGRWRIGAIGHFTNK